MFKKTPTLWAVMSLLPIVLLLTASSALAHAALGSSDPEPGARLDAVPEMVRVSYTEPPTQDSRFEVFDGCRNEVTNSIEILNDTIEATVRGAQPGRWNVEWQVVSAVDGHATRDSISFRVAGELDCSAVRDPDDDDQDTGGSAGGGSLVPIALASAAIVAVAVVIRFLTRKGESR